MATQDYHDDFDNISKTMLSDFLDSSYEYWCRYVAKTMAPSKPKKQMLIGEAVHAIVLDKLSPSEVVAIYPDECFKHDKSGRQVGLNPKPAEEFRREHSKRICLKSTEYLVVKKCVQAIGDHELGRLIGTEGVIFETPFYWTCVHSGLKCRMCGDIVAVIDDVVHCWDIKTTARPKPHEFEKVRKQFRYWLQDTHYSHGLAANFPGRRVDFCFWAIETGEPYRIAPYKFPEIVREELHDRYANVMLSLAQAYETNEWRDPWTKQVNYLNVSPYEFDDTDPGLDFSEEEETDED